MNAIESNLARYLELERLLNAFFSAFNFCYGRCITPNRVQNGGLPVAACCTNKYYVLFDLDHAAFERLRREREGLYGKPWEHAWMNPVSPCEYHDPQNGCILRSHKSPTCLAFLCRKAIDRLRTEFDICFYDYLGVSYALEWVLTGIFPEPDYRELKRDLITAITKVERISHSGNHGIRGRSPCPLLGRSDLPIRY
jgi:hypothetical protein